MEFGVQKKMEKGARMTLIIIARRVYTPLITI